MSDTDSNLTESMTMEWDGYASNTPATIELVVAYSFIPRIAEEGPVEFTISSPSAEGVVAGIFDGAWQSSPNKPNNVELTGRDGSKLYFSYDPEKVPSFKLKETVEDCGELQFDVCKDWMTLRCGLKLRIQ